MDRVGDNKISITHEDFPVFLYESGTKYDRENEDAGLFRGYLLVRVRRIFQIESRQNEHSRRIDPFSLDHPRQWIWLKRGQTRRRRKSSSLRM